MFKEYYGMVLPPFAKDIPPEAMYESPAMKEVLERIKYTVENDLFAVLTADPGCGKSTEIRRLKSELPKDEYVLLYLSDSKLTPRDLYKGLLNQLGVEGKNNRSEAKHQLQKEVEAIRCIQKKRVVCVLDEAHLLEKETIEEFRFLLNCDCDSKNPMALVLCGQTELWDEKLRLKRYAAVKQRVDINCVLPHLDRAETESYIRAHLAYSGCGQEIFTAHAIDEIYKTSSGIMRVINKVCKKALMYGAQQQHRLIDDRDILYVTEHEMIGGGA